MSRDIQVINNVLHLSNCVNNKTIFYLDKQHKEEIGTLVSDAEMAFTPSPFKKLASGKLSRYFRISDNSQIIKSRVYTNNMSEVISCLK